MARKPDPRALAKHQELQTLRLDELLRYLGEARISRELFWRYMTEFDLGDADIDSYCAKHGRWNRSGVSDADLEQFWKAIYGLF